MRYLGIDGGGSKTTFLLVDEYYNELCHLHTGPSNWLSVGADAAKSAIRDGVSKLTERPNVVCAGFAGAARPESASFYREVLTTLIPDATIIVESDAFIASIGSIGVDPGVLLIAGTGSIVIGREAVRAALRSMDSQERPEFAGRIAQSLGLKSMAEVVGAWASGKIGVPDIAGLFPEIAALYPAEPANRILTEAASHLRSLVEIASNRVGVEDCRRSLSGSVATHPIIRNLIGFTFEEPRHSPELGAVIWARQHFAEPL